MDPITGMCPPSCFSTDMPDTLRKAMTPERARRIFDVAKIRKPMPPERVLRIVKKLEEKRALHIYQAEDSHLCR